MLQLPDPRSFQYVSAKLKTIVPNDVLPVGSNDPRHQQNYTPETDYSIRRGAQLLAETATWSTFDPASYLDQVQRCAPVKPVLQMAPVIESQFQSLNFL
jgi:hypothetical protein